MQAGNRHLLNRVIGDFKMNQNETKNITVPVWEKYALNLKEAVQYFGIGERKLQMIADKNRDTGIVIYNGVKLLFKRQKFEEWLDKTNAI